jgi:hypothetical protein
MAKHKVQFESLTGMAQQTAEQMKEQTQRAMENYVSWLQNAMSTFPWVNTDLNKKLVNHATENVTATFIFLQKLSQAKNLEDVTKIQTEFMGKQLNSTSRQRPSPRHVPKQRQPQQKRRLVCQHDSLLRT